MVLGSCGVVVLGRRGGARGAAVFWVVLEWCVMDFVELCGNMLVSPRVL